VCLQILDNMLLLSGTPTARRVVLLAPQLSLLGSWSQAKPAMAWLLFGQLGMLQA
jgi:hypothetical protein